MAKVKLTLPVRWHGDPLTLRCSKCSSSFCEHAAEYVSEGKDVPWDEMDNDNNWGHHKYRVPMAHLTVASENVQWFGNVQLYRMEKARFWDVNLQASLDPVTYEFVGILDMRTNGMRTLRSMLFDYIRFQTTGPDGRALHSCQGRYHDQAISQPWQTDNGIASILYQRTMTLRDEKCPHCIKMEREMLDELVPNPF